MATTLPLDEAARRLRIHPATLRRRLRKGLVRGVKQETAQGYVWLVEVDDPPAPESTQADAYAPSTQPPAPDLRDQEVRRLSDHVQDLRDQLKAREREVAELHVTINRLLLALPAPAPLSTTVETPGGQAEQPAPQTQSDPGANLPPGRRWWHRLGDWLSGAPSGAQPAGG